MIVSAGTKTEKQLRKIRIKRLASYRDRIGRLWLYMDCSAAQEKEDPIFRDSMLRYANRVSQIALEMQSEIDAEVASGGK